MRRRELLLKWWMSLESKALQSILKISEDIISEIRYDLVEAREEEDETQNFQDLDFDQIDREIQQLDDEVDDDQIRSFMGNQALMNDNRFLRYQNYTLSEQLRSKARGISRESRRLRQQLADIEGWAKTVPEEYKTSMPFWAKPDQVSMEPKQGDVAPDTTDQVYNADQPSDLGVLVGKIGHAEGWVESVVQQVTAKPVDGLPQPTDPPCPRQRKHKKKTTP
jgi:hypothetical protein